mgnify:FL=1
MIFSDWVIETSYNLDCGKIDEVLTFSSPASSQLFIDKTQMSFHVLQKTRIRSIEKG